MNDRRNLPSRLFDACLLIFVGALLLHLAVQIIEGIKWWLLGGLGIAGLIVLSAAVFRYRRERW